MPQGASLMAKRSSTEYCVHTGAPSWHQRRAGHGSAGAMCFSKKIEAMKFLRRVKKLRPNEPAFIVMSKRGLGRGRFGISLSGPSGHGGLHP